MFSLIKTEAVTLETLLKLDILINKEDRLRLGVEVASAMMQLHTTEWLGGPGESWGKRDIFVLQRAIKRQRVEGGTTLVWEPLLEKPFVSRTFGSQKCSAVSSKSPVVDYDKNLFSLGIILIELSLQSCIEDLRDHSWDQSDRISPVVGGQPHQLCDNPDYITATQRIGEVFRAEQEDYGLAVQRCINGLSLPDEPITKSLDNLQYKNEVHTNIISLLERNLKVHNHNYRTALSYLKLNANFARHSLDLLPPDKENEMEVMTSRIESVVGCFFSSRSNREGF